MEQNKKELYELLSSKKCYVFVAGNAKDMPTAVKDVFINILKTNENLPNTMPINYIDTMEATGFYQTETWS